MLNFLPFQHKVYIYGSEVDEWGLLRATEDGVEVDATIKEQLDVIEMKNQKGKSVVVKYIILFPSDVDIKETDLIGFYDEDCTFKKFEVLKISKGRDLSGAIMYSKAWA